MKKIFLLLFIPWRIMAQEQIPRLENDTLYTSSGFKIYKGQQLKLTKGSGGGKFRYIKNGNESLGPSYANATFIVTEIKKIFTSGLGNTYVSLKAVGPPEPGAIFKTNTLYPYHLNIIFDEAINPRNGSFPELSAPEEFRKKDVDIIGQIERLKQLLDSKAITEEEYEAAKKKLLN